MAAPPTASADDPTAVSLRLQAPDAARPDAQRCLMCLRRCSIATGQAGYCHSVVNRDGRLYSTIYGLLGEYGIDPIEKKPVRWYQPGTRVLSLGSLGCNLRCGWCQNWEIAFADARTPPTAPRMLPGRVVAYAQQHGCAGIAWTFNEPSIWVDYIYDCAQAARAAGLYTVLVTNGMFTPESIDLLAPWIDVYRADFKSLDDRLYREHTHVAGADGIRDGIVRMARHGAHVELVTVVMPGYHDDEHLARMARWIVETLGPATPWHLSRFVPYAHVTDIAATPDASIAAAARIGRAAGLRRIAEGDWYEQDHA